MNRKLVWPLLLAGAAGLVSLWLAPELGPPLPPVPPVPEASEVPAPSHEGAPSARAQSPSPARPAPSAQASVAPTPPPPDEDPIGTRVAWLDSALVADPPDSAWSSAAEAQALEHLSGRTDVETLGVACGATFCRIEFAVLDPFVSPHDIVRAATPWRAPAFVTMDLEGERVATLFLAREGHVLPEG
jgi:hypothetical protein